MRALNPHDCVYYGAPQPKPGQVAGKNPVFCCPHPCIFVVSYLSTLRVTDFFPFVTCSQRPTSPNCTNEHQQQRPPTRQTWPPQSQESSSMAADTACSSTPTPACSPATAPPASLLTAQTAPCHPSPTCRTTPSPTNSTRSQPKTCSTSKPSAKSPSAWPTLEGTARFRSSV